MVNKKLVKDMFSNMKKLIDELNHASELYYNFGTSPMSDAEYDLKLNQLRRLEELSGIVYSNSPTNKVGYIILNNLEKINIIDKPMLSLDKVHSDEEIKSFAKGKEIVGMIKCDGLSIRLKYNNGKLVSANTRGDGYVGGNITEHIKHFLNVPLTIDFENEYIIDGEAIIKTLDFEAINKNNEFKNPRNTAAGTLNLLDMKEVAQRKLSFIAWDVIEGVYPKTFLEKLKQAEGLGFEVVYHSVSDSNEEIINKAKQLGIPYDGVVWKLNDIAYGDSLGKTEHHFLNAVAWKPKDEEYDTWLNNIEWTMGRTGQLTPIACFKPVDTGDSIIERASLHNISIMKQLLGTPYSGQTITVFKANDIIPQISSGGIPECKADIEGLEFTIPTECPICGGKLEVVCDADTEVLMCTNDACEGKLVNRLDHFCGKKGLDIKGLSKATLSKLVDWGWVDSFASLYCLHQYRDEWIDKPGFGIKSVDNILAAIKNSRKPKLESFICALGIPHVGKTLSHELTKYFCDYKSFKIAAKDKWDFTKIDKVAYEKATAIWNFDFTEADLVDAFIYNYEIDEPAAADNLSSTTVVITGKLLLHKNRDELIKRIIEHGGKVTGSVSKNTNILINNDVNSTSSKNISAQRLGIPIMTEEEFVNLYLS